VRAHTLLLFLSGAVVWVAYGCGGESETRASRSGAGPGASGQSGVGKGGTAGKGGAAAGHGGGILETRGGSSGTSGGGGDSGSMDISGAPSGGSAAESGTGLGGGGRGGTSGRGGSGGKGGTSGQGGTEVVGGAGSGCWSEPGWGGEPFDHCCIGDDWGFNDEYYATSANSCGEPRSCDVGIGLHECQDDPRFYMVNSRCCADGHPGDAVLNEMAQQLHHRFGIEHATIQIELADTDEACVLTPEHVV